jgi:hypothetical protein
MTVYMIIKKSNRDDTIKNTTDDRFISDRLYPIHVCSS